MLEVPSVTRSRCLFVLAVVISALSPRATLGQGDLEFSLIPRVGMVSFGGDLYETSAWEGGAVYSSQASLRAAPSYGAALELGSHRAGLRLRASADYSHAVQLDLRFVEWRCGEICSTLPSQSLTPGGGNSGFLVVGVDAVLPLQLALGPVESYLAVGVGLTRYSFSSPDVPFESVPGWELPTSGSASSLRLGGGFDIPVRGQLVTIGFMDNISRYWGETQHHVMSSVGIKLRR